MHCVLDRKLRGTLLLAAIALCAVATAGRPAQADMFVDKYAQLGGYGGPLGLPTRVVCVPGAYDPDPVSFNGNVPACQIKILTCADGQGLYVNFMHGALYYHPNIGNIFAVYGGIYQKWASLGLEASFLGYPISDEVGCADGRGRDNDFQYGSIYWTPQTGAHEVHGAIRDKWAEFGWEHGFGYPITDETSTPDGKGRYNHFERCSIYWTPQTGAHEVHGAIRDLWDSMGWERSWLGYPISDEQDAPGGGRISYFQGGSISWTPQGGAVAHPR
jgi:uncharacterized protein with LGFP repeats